MKSNTTLSLDVEVIIECTKRKVNKSKLCNEFLINYLKLEKNNNKNNFLEEDILIAEAKLADLRLEKDKKKKAAEEVSKNRIFVK